MKKTFLLLGIVLSLLMMNTTLNVHAEERLSNNEICINDSVIELKYGLQKLWIEHAWWTRSIIVSKLADLEDQKDVLARLLQNQIDLGNAIKPYYGDEVENQLTQLLQEHIIIAGKIIDAAKAGDEKNVEKFNQDWVRNADDIVAFLTKANPNLDKKELTEMFYTHLKYTTDEVEHRLNKDWQADIKTADSNEAHLIHMGDILTDAIVKQFPEKFQ